jgi:Uma2 family endonuclease
MTLSLEAFFMYQFNSPRPPHQVLPTMYDLPSEDPREPGLPDEFHEFQPQLLRETFRSPEYSMDDVFIGTDINLYYDSLHPQWYKRPDWFLVLGVARAQVQEDLRLSYVIWQESVAPFLMVELLSPGTEDEDLGQKVRSLTERDTPPGKWEVYERILRVPYYAIFDRYSNQLRVFCLQGTRYQEMALSEQQLWFEEIKLGLGVWQGRFQGAMGLWLRWFDEAGWLPTPGERAEQEKLRAEQEKLRAERAENLLEEERARSQKLLDQLRSLGVDPDGG